MKKGIYKKSLSFVIAAVFSMALLDSFNYNSVIADNVDELEAQIEANNSAIYEKRRELEQLQEDSDSAREYISVLKDKMTLQQENIDIINDQLDQLESDILQRSADIDALQVVIDAKKDEIDSDITDFRSRLRQMYVSGSDSTASILTGASDFYDLLARMELVSRIARYDDNLIDGLNAQLSDYNTQNEKLENQKSELRIQKKNAESKRDVLQGEMNALLDEYDESQRILEDLIDESYLAQSDIDWLNSQNAELNDQIEYIREQERIEAEKARKEAAEREERKRIERERELERQRQESESNSYNNYDDDDYDSYDDDDDDYYEITVDTNETSYNGDRDEIVDYAKTYLGVYYQWCGSYPSTYGLDCSHFTWRVLEHFGLMPYYMDSRSQCSYCTEISYSELQPGDLVFYRSGSGRVEHVTMYIGGGQIIGAQGGDSWVTSESAAESINAKVKIVSLDSDGRSKSYGRVPGL